MVTGLIITYLLIPIGIGIVLGFFGNPARWKLNTIFGAGILFFGMSLLKTNLSVSLAQAMSTTGLVMALEAFLLGCGAVMLIRQQQLETNKNGNP